MDKRKIIQKIIEKKEFSQLPKGDIERVYCLFEKRQCSDEEKIRLTRDLLRKIYSAFTSGKLLNIKDKDEEWFLRKHLSTKERLDFYSELYPKLLSLYERVSVIDLGAGINGLSYKFFPRKVRINYLAIEAMGQLTDLMNFYFKKNNCKFNAIHESLFNLDKIKKLIKNCKFPRVVFLFKVLDSLEMLEKNYSKKFLSEIAPLSDKVVISFATRRMVKKSRFKVSRKWIIEFIKDNFDLLEYFELGNERYIIFKKKV